MLDINVLIVDDDLDQLDIVKAHLEAAHLVVETAASGEEALDLLSYYRPEVVVSDVKMPVMDGHELFHRVRAHDGLQDVAFLFRSVAGDLPQRLEGLRIGADDYIVKTSDLDELLLKIRFSIEKHRKLRFLREMAESRQPFGILTGCLVEVPVAELLQMISLLNLGDVCVTLRSEAQIEGSLYTNDNRVLHAEAAGAIGPKAFFRLLRFTDGLFRVTRKAWAFAPTIDESLEKCLLEGVTRLDRARALESRVLAYGSSFTVSAAAEILRHHFDESTAKLIALAGSRPRLEEILDGSPAADDDTLFTLGELLDAGILIGSGQEKVVDPALPLSGAGVFTDERPWSPAPAALLR